jgi:hypothetical protein
MSKKEFCEFFFQTKKKKIMKNEIWDMGYHIRKCKKRLFLKIFFICMRLNIFIILNNNIINGVKIGRK